METRPNMDDYLKAAKIISTCPKNRLPFVLEVISKSGIDVPEIEKMLKKSLAAEKKSLYSKKDGFKSEKELEPSDDDTIRRLQKAYYEGISFTVLARVADMERTVLYRYIYGERKMKEAHAEKINNALDKIYLEGGFDA